MRFHMTDDGSFILMGIGRYDRFVRIPEKQPLIDWCFCVEVSHIGTFEDDVKYVIAFVFFCSFYGKKYFENMMGYPALKLFLLHKRS